MKAKKIIAMLLTTVMVVTLAGCGNGAGTPASTDTAAEVTTETAEAAPEAATEAREMSIDFEDGVFGFVGMDMTAGNADESVLSVEDYNGSKALKIVPQDKYPYVAFQADALLGDNISKLKTIIFDIGIENPDGEFYACSGNVATYTGEDNSIITKAPWSVYLADKNPKTATVAVDVEMAAGNYFTISLEVDNGKDAGVTRANMYIDNISFMDEAGAVMTVDKAAVYVSPVKEDPWAGLTPIAGETEIEGFAVSADGWAQAGIDTTLNGGTFDATTLKAGDIITIYYESAGEAAENMWLVGVSSGNPKGDWIRICGDQAEGTAMYNADKTKCQITYEQLVEALGEDFATTLSCLQCESDGAWQVFKVTVGTEAVSLYNVANAVDIEGFEVSADGWAQAGVDTTLNGGTFDAATIVPGSVVTINYESEGTAAENMWLVGVSSGNPNGDWIRICGDQAEGTAIYNEDKTVCQITYDQIVAALGEDFASTLSCLQCESDGAWSVYSVSVGMIAASYTEAANQVEIEGFEVSADGWAQAGIDTTLNGGTFDATTLKPGDILTITYESEGTAAENMWLVGVSSGNPNGDWIRICGDQAEGTAVYNDDKTKCQITYEQIVDALGEDFASTLSCLQCESDGKWSVYSVTIGQ